MRQWRAGSTEPSTYSEMILFMKKKYSQCSMKPLSIGQGRHTAQTSRGARSITLLPSLVAPRNSFRSPPAHKYYIPPLKDLYNDLQHTVIVNVSMMKTNSLLSA